MAHLTLIGSLTDTDSLDAAFEETTIMSLRKALHRAVSFVKGGRGIDNSVRAAQVTEDTGFSALILEENGVIIISAETHPFTIDPEPSKEERFRLQQSAAEKFAAIIRTFEGVPVRVEG